MHKHHYPLFLESRHPEHRMVMRWFAIGMGWICLIAILLLLAMANNLRAQSAAATQPAGKCHALLIAGTPGTPIYDRRFQDWLKRFHAYLANNGVANENILTLSGKKRESILTAIDALSQKIRPQDQFILILIGHGSRSDAKPTLLLPGPDLDAETLAKALTPIQSHNQVILNFTSTSGDFLKALTKTNRVNITATMPEENAEPVLAEFFLRKLEKDRTVTLLDAYNWSTHQTALWISRQVAQEDGTWTVHGRESVEIFKKLFDGCRQLGADSDANKEDEPVPLVVPRDIKPGTASYWAGRRIINEHAQLEDHGTDNSVTALTGEAGYSPITPDKENAEGSLAAKIVLGQAGLSTARGEK